METALFLSKCKCYTMIKIMKLNCCCGWDRVLSPFNGFFLQQMPLSLSEDFKLEKVREARGGQTRAMEL